MKEINCIFCNKKSDEIVIVENDYSCKKCHQCGLIYLSPRPTLKEIKNLYKKDHAYISAEDRIAPEYIKNFHAKHHMKLIKKFIKQGSLLEIGPGGGQFLYDAKENGFDPYGIELNPKQAQFINNKMKIPCEDQELSIDSFKRKMFDVIYHCDVLSHFYDPINELKKMNAKLRMNGYLVFETGILTDVNTKFLSLFHPFQLPDHLFFFSDSSMQSLLQKTGFSFIKIIKYSISIQILAINLISRIRRRKTNSGKNEFYQSKNSIPFPTPDHTNKLRTLLKKSYHYFLHFLRYNLGYLLPKKHVPVTAIIIAKKTSQCN